MSDSAQDDSANAIYLNHAGTSWPKPDAVRQAMQAAERASPDAWPALLESAQSQIAAFFDVSPDRLLLTPGCTSAINVAITAHAWQPGDCVVTSHFEHHAVQRCLTQLQQQGVDVRTLPPCGDELVDLQELDAVLASDRVKLVAITAACNVTGQLLPIRDCIDLVHRYDALILIDGAQIAGWSRLNLRELDADLFTFAGHKGLQAPWGIGGLFVADRVSMHCSQAVCSVHSAKHTAVARMPGYCDVGSVNMPAIAGLAAGCQWLSEPEQCGRLDGARHAAGALTDQLRPIPGITIHHDVPLQHRMPTVAVSVEGRDSSDLAAKLCRRGVIASAGFQCSPRSHEALGTSQHGVLRFSFGPSQSIAHANRAAKAMRELAES